MQVFVPLSDSFPSQLTLENKRLLVLTRQVNTRQTVCIPCFTGVFLLENSTFTRVISLKTYIYHNFARRLMHENLCLSRVFQCLLFVSVVEDSVFSSVYPLVNTQKMANFLWFTDVLAPEKLLFIVVFSQKDAFPGIFLHQWIRENALKSILQRFTVWLIQGKQLKFWHSLPFFTVH